MYSLFKQNIKSCDEKRRRQRLRTLKKQEKVLLAKATLHVQHTFFVHFFAVALHDYNVKLPETFLWRKYRTYSRSLPLIFSLHWWTLAFLILSPPLQNFHVLTTKKCLRCFLSLALDLCRPFSRWVSLACRFFSVFFMLYIPNLWTWQFI